MSAIHGTASLWLLRHAQPLIASGVCYGQLDVPADQGHTLQAAMQFAAQMPAHVVLRYSPLQRCEQLAQALPVTDAHRHVDIRLQEMHFGQWEGVAWSDIGQAQVHAWSQDLYGTAPGGGESLGAMLLRVGAALRESWWHDSQQGQRDVVWVTHAGVARCVQWLLQYGQAQPTAGDWRLPAPAYGGWLQLPWQPHVVALQALA